ncbi:phosphatase PAP2 family protein [Clostridium sp. D33t1_170424_F3]|uniref:phosphatase PAP2 family protein n=1 Tax=Clostridium sp. D33t1_170424_F3 TaxID=2787099 RepID=UPI0018A9097D|nr:phosphatase PAP2 family protein [Clostridium sp. D33t1_170424_F3]
MQKKTKRSFLLTGLLFLASIVFTLLVQTVDVQPIGPEQSLVGFAAINRFLFQQTGFQPFWYTVTDWIGILALLTAAGFAITGLAQLIHRRSLQKVDRSLLLLGGFYILTAAVYVLFEIFTVNYRPVLIGGVLEASFPSSHVMFVYCIMATAVMQFHHLVKNRAARAAFGVYAVIVIAVTVIGRFLSGVHWFTDLLGGLLIGSALILLYRSVVQMAGENPQHKTGVNKKKSSEKARDTTYEHKKNRY